MRRALLALLTVAIGSAAHADFVDELAARDDVPLHKSPHTGHSRALVIPVEVAGFTPVDRVALARFFEGDDSTFAAYWRDNSGGRFTVDAHLAPTVHYDACPFPDYPGCKVPRGDIGAIKQGIAVVKEVLQKTAAAGVHFRDYDVNGLQIASDGTVHHVPDGFADMVVMVFTMPWPSVALPIWYFDPDGPAVVDGVKIPIVAMARGPSVALHESSHVLGPADLYSELPDWRGLAYSLMGDWDYDQNPPMLDALTRYTLQWTRVTDVRGTRRLTLAPAASGGAVVRLGGGREFYLVEARAPGTRWDRGLKSAGLAVYHVDWAVGPSPKAGEFLARQGGACMQCNAWHPFVSNVEADGDYGLLQGAPQVDEHDLFRNGSSLLPSADHAPFGEQHHPYSSNRFDGSETGVKIEDVSVDDASGSVTATFTAPAGGDACADLGLLVKTGTRADICDPGTSCHAGECLPDTPGCGCGGGAVGLPGLLLAGYFFLKRASRASLGEASGSSRGASPKSAARAFFAALF